MHFASACYLVLSINCFSQTFTVSYPNLPFNGGKRSSFLTYLYIFRFLYNGFILLFAFKIFPLLKDSGVLYIQYHCSLDRTSENISVYFPLLIFISVFIITRVGKFVNTFLKNKVYKIFQNPLDERLYS